MLALDKGRSFHTYTSYSVMRKFFGLQVLYGHKFCVRWIPSELNNATPDLVSFRILSMCQTIRSQQQLLHPFSVNHKHLMTRATKRSQVSLLPIAWFLDGVSRRTTGVPPVRNKFNSRLSGEGASPPQPPETLIRRALIPFPRRFGQGGKATPTAKRATSTRWATNCVNEGGFALWSTTY